MEERVSSKRVCRKSALLPRRIFFSLLLPLVPFYIFLFLLLPLQLSSSTTLIGHWQTMLKRTPMSPMKWALYRINDPPDVCVCLREKNRAFPAAISLIKDLFPAEISTRLFDLVIRGYYIASWNWVKTRRWFQGCIHTHADIHRRIRAQRKMD